MIPVEIIRGFPGTSDYEPDKDDVYIERDGYLCVIQTSHCNNIILVSAGKHENSLLEDVKWIIEHAVSHYGKAMGKAKGKAMFLVNNNRWCPLLDRTGLVKALFKGENYSIYGQG